MTISKNILAGSGAVASAYEIEQSLIFEDGSSAYLTRTPSSASNRKTWTWSGWVKRGNLSGLMGFLSACDGNAANTTWIGFSNDSLVNIAADGDVALVTTAVFRDPSAWYHIVFVYDSTQGTASNRQKIYVNGVQETSFSTANYSSQNLDSFINNNVQHTIGSRVRPSGSPVTFFDGYLAETHFIDGTALAPSSFGETNEDTGQWIPKEYTGGSYGTNGFYLPFSKSGGGGSAYYDGSGDRLTTPSSSDFAFGTGDFTIEGWYYLTASFASGNQYFFDLGSNGLRIQFYNGTVYYIVDGSNEVTTTAAGVTHNNWYHIAAVRYNSQMNLYIDGVSRGTKDSVTTNLSAQALTIGAYGANGTNALTGYTSNFRVSNSAIYTSNFTPSTTPLTNLSSTKLLMNGGVSSIVGPALTVAGNTKFSVFQPFASSVTTFASDTSGQGNNMTVANLLNSDVVTDSPTNNFATLNPLHFIGTNGALPYEGNLKVVGGSYPCKIFPSTIAAPGGKFYAEFTQATSSYPMVGVSDVGLFRSLHSTGGVRGVGAITWDLGSTNGRYYINSGTQTDSAGKGTSGSIIQVAIDADSRKIWFGIDNTWNASGNPAAGSNEIGTVGGTGALVFFMRPEDTTQTANFGQNGFAYTPPTGFKALCTKNLPEPSAVALAPRDHFKTVTYTGTGSTQTVSGVGFQPDLLWIKRRDAVSNHHAQDTVRGISASSTKTLFPNLAVAEENQGAGTNKVSAVNSDGFVIDGNSGNLNTGSALYLTHAWKAGGTTPAKTYTVKVVSDSGNKYRFDDFAASAQTVDLQEGGTYTFDQSDSSNSGHPFRLSTTSNGTHASGSEYTTGVVTTGSPGSAGAKTVITVAASAPTLYYYCSVHSGMGGQVNTNSIFGSTNFDGNRTSIVSANVDAGFSIGTHGHNLATSDTFGHGLGVPPVLIIEAKRDVNGGDWIAQHSLLDGSADYMRINTIGDNNNGWSGMNLPTSTVYNGSVGAGGGATNVVSYCFAEVPGYSKGGVYTGNGNIDGPFVHLGFEPAWILMKRAVGGTYEWIVQDNVRSPDNPNRLIHWFGFNYATNSPSVRMDFLSNGFKFRNVSQALNTNTHKYIYFAIAESPFKYANAQ